MPFALADFFIAACAWCDVLAAFVAEEAEAAVFAVLALAAILRLLWTATLSTEAAVTALLAGFRWLAIHTAAGDAASLNCAI